MSHGTSPFHSIAKKSKRGFRGYPVATIALYGPNQKVASKAAVGIVKRDGAEPEAMEKWHSDSVDIRHNSSIAREIVEFICANGVASVVITDGIIGCPHEEGIDYPEGHTCPKCPFWDARNRFTGEIQH